VVQAPLADEVCAIEILKIPVSKKNRIEMLFFMGSKQIKVLGCDDITNMRPMSKTLM
jgi:hypothetical protein